MCRIQEAAKSPSTNFQRLLSRQAYLKKKQTKLDREFRILSRANQSLLSKVCKKKESRERRDKKMRLEREDCLSKQRKTECKLIFNLF